MAAPVAAAVIVPARNEERLLPGCLDAIELAIGMVDVPVRVVVALDSCVDGTLDVVTARPWVDWIEVAAGNVGQVRSAAAARALQLSAHVRSEELWLASTDADSRVPVDWLALQLELAADGWEATVGTVAVDDWSGHGDETRTAWTAAYQPVEHHPHIHGANLGMTAAAYLDAGGFPPVPVGEDVALVAALAGRRVIRTASHPVITSSRREARAAGGFADHLSSLAG
jgi:hypothetical protein